MSQQTIVVLGATGQQGGAVVDSLLGSGGFTVIATTRNPESSSAKKLIERGCQVKKLSSLEDKDGLTELFKGVDGVYAVTTPGKKFDCAAEKRQGESIVEAAKAASVPFLVFSSVGSAADKTGIPHFDSKGYIEDLIEASGIPFFVVRPVAFMENLGSEFMPLVKGQLTTLCDPSVKLQLISVADIGKITASAFRDPKSFQGKKLEFAGDSLTAFEQGAILGKLRGDEPYKPKLIPGFILYLFAHEIYVMKKFFDTKGYHADIDECKSYVPSLMSYEDFLKFKGYATCEFKEPKSCCIQ